MALRFTRVKETDAELLLKWRTDPEISRNMFTDLVEPSLEKQKLWIRSLADRADYIGYMICDDAEPVGYLCFADIDFTHARCSTGSYIYPRDARLKYGVTLHTYVCNYVFHRLKLNKIVNFVMNANQKVLKIQQLHKARLVGYLQQHIFKNGTFHDVHIFEQLKDDWIKQNQYFELSVIRSAFDDWREE